MNKTDLAFPYDSHDESHRGLTKREYIATTLLAGFMAKQDYNDIDLYILRSVLVTDELLKQLSES